MFADLRQLVQTTTKLSVYGGESAALPTLHTRAGAPGVGPHPPGGRPAGSGACSSVGDSVVCLARRGRVGGAGRGERFSPRDAPAPALAVRASGS